MGLVGPLLDLRKQINAALEATGQKVSVNDVIVKATARKRPGLCKR